MLTVVLGLGSALGYALHDFLMVKVVRAAAVWTAMCWSLGVGLVILLPLALVLYGLPAGAAEWRATAFAMGGGVSLGSSACGDGRKRDAGPRSRAARRRVIQRRRV